MASPWHRALTTQSRSPRPPAGPPCPTPLTETPQLTPQPAPSHRSTRPTSVPFPHGDRMRPLAQPPMLLPLPMAPPQSDPVPSHRRPIPQTRNWGAWKLVSLYLRRCQIDTPDSLVHATWRHVHEIRPNIGKALDFGAGDGRFSRHGRYAKYIGYEIDGDRSHDSRLPHNAEIRHRCAFSDVIDDADLCIGNPPFVRNQALPPRWRLQVARILLDRTGVSLSGLANAWQYFFLLALASVRPDGLCALVVPYEWVSRPSARALREFISANGWGVSVYRLTDSTFNSVLTTSSITLVDKAVTRNTWAYFHETRSGSYTSLPSPSNASHGVIGYMRRSAMTPGAPRAVRGLSPGTQEVLALTEAERVHLGLATGRDVVPCVTTLRHLSAASTELDTTTFRDTYVTPGHKCWIVRTDIDPSPVLAAYLDAVPLNKYQTKTCLEREHWWKFNMPPVPPVLIAMSFRGPFPKLVLNSVGARAVGGVYGIHNVTSAQARHLIHTFNDSDIRDRLVHHSNGLCKIEIGQLNTLLTDTLSGVPPST